MCRLPTAELSIVIPLLNEEGVLPQLFHALESQTNICCEVIFCDGGSLDDTLKLVADYAAASRHQIKIVSGPQGRGQQMNQGAETSSSSRLLFLHADSFFQQETFLRDALSDFVVAEENHAPTAIAAHFTLTFCGKQSESRFYHYLSEKSQLNRRGTIYGDQGMLLSKKLWQRMGGFNRQQVILEDVLFAEAVMAHGQWILLPQQLMTSNRRYQQQGRLRRVIKNALLLIVAGSGYPSLLSTSLMAEYHETPHVSQRVPSFAILLHRMSLTCYVSFWYGCGRAVAHNFWLVVYLIGWTMPWLKSEQRLTLLDHYDRRGAVLLFHPVSYSVFAALSLIVFYLSYLCFPLNWLVQRRDEQY